MKDVERKVHFLKQIYKVSDGHNLRLIDFIIYSGQNGN